MSQSNLQLLLHAGEWEYIIKSIKASKQSKYVGGCLFGLWRNSLKQPVIQFVTDSGSDKNVGQHASIEKMFENRRTKHYAEIIKNDHRLLHLGFWFYGSQEEQNEAKRIVLKPKNVLLFINFSKDGDNSEMWTGEYHLKKDPMEASSLLYREDVLDGHSSFRLYGPLTEQIKDSKVSPKPTSNSVQNYLDYLPSRVQVEEAVTSEEQWYSAGEGTQHLQLLFQYFQEAGITPEMSRDTITQDMQFGLNGGYCLDFPANFPKRMPTLRGLDGAKYEVKRKYNPDEDVCATVVRTVTEFLRKQQQSSRHGRGGRW